MPVLTVRLENRFRDIPCRPGQSVREILDSTDIRVRAGCNGNGACGLCRIRIESGKANEPTEKEQNILDSALRTRGVRLACQARPVGNIRIEIVSPAPRSNWKNLPWEKGWKTPQLGIFPLREYDRRIPVPYGVAIDLGTTHISISLLNLATGEQVAGRIGQNPQISSGSDIMTRLAEALGSPVQAGQLKKMVHTAIGDVLQDIATREGIDLFHVERLALVGNTAMLALLSGRNYGLLSIPGHWTDFIDCTPDSPGGWAAAWNINPAAAMEIIPPLAGFVGSDLLAGVLATHLTESDVKGLFIDFGTNSEIALWDGEVLRVTSTAGGPAFEGSGFSSGMSAEPGAIYRVRFRKKRLELSTIGGNHARGICGSGIVDLISGLVARGILTEKGTFLPGYPGEGFVITGKDPRIVLGKPDVDFFQQAKAAIGTGIQVLLSRAGIKYTDLQHIFIGGLFGHFLDIKNAQNIGLLPSIHSGLIHLCGNTALNGCRMLLLSSQAGDQINIIRRDAEIINLAQCLDFDEIYLENLYLRPFMVMES